MYTESPDAPRDATWAKTKRRQTEAKSSAAALDTQWWAEKVCCATLDQIVSIYLQKMPKLQKFVVRLSWYIRQWRVLCLLVSNHPNYHVGIQKFCSRHNTAKYFAPKLTKLTKNCTVAKNYITEKSPQN